MYYLAKKMQWTDEQAKWLTVTRQITEFRLGHRFGRVGDSEGDSRSGGRRLCADAAPGSRRWGAASSTRTPDNSARGGGSRAVPETLTSSLGRSCPRRGAQSWARPSPSAVAPGRSAGCRGGTEPGEGARGGSARGCPRRGEAARGAPATREVRRWAGGAEPAMGEAPSPAPALWDWGYLDRCFARHRVCISFGLWICASSCWIAAHTLLLYLRCAKKSRQDQSALCAACCLLTSLCDTVGAILARQLTIQVFTGAYLAAVDLMNFVFILFPVCGSKLKSNSGGVSQKRKRRQRLRASIFALTLPLSLGPCWALWAAVPNAPGLVQGPQRRLLGSLLQDSSEVFGYLLGGIAALGSWASRIPPLSRIVRLGWGWDGGSPWQVLGHQGALSKLQVTRAERWCHPMCACGWGAGGGWPRSPETSHWRASCTLLFLIANDRLALRKKPPELDQ